MGSAPKFKRFIQLTVLWVVLILSVSCPAFALSCPPLTPTGLAVKIAAENDKNTEILFFSSWCGDCAEHLKNVKSEKVLLVGAFDKKERIENVLKKLGLKNPCFIDSGIAARLDVKVVPASRFLGERDLPALLQK